MFVRGFSPRLVMWAGLFWENCLSFSRGHFTDWGGSVITFGGLGRITCLVKVDMGVRAWRLVV